MVRHGIVEASIGSVIQHRGPDNLIFKILVYISRFAGQGTHVGSQSIQAVYRHFALEVPGNKVGDQPVEGFAKGGLPATVVANDCQEVPFLHLHTNVLQDGAVSSGIGIG